MTLLDDLKALKDKYRELQEVTRRQPTVIAAGQLDLLQRLVDQKQKLMGDVEKITARTQACMKAAGDLPADERARVNTLVDEVKEELQALLKFEEESRLALEAKRDTASDGMKRISKGKKARDVYGGGTAGGRFIDQGG